MFLSQLETFFFPIDNSLNVYVFRLNICYKTLLSIITTSHLTRTPHDFFICYIVSTMVKIQIVYFKNISGNQLYSTIG